VIDLVQGEGTLGGDPPIIATLSAFLPDILLVGVVDVACLRGET
jgi:hypothetical protein